MTSLIAPVQVKDQVYQILREALINHEFQPGEPLREAALNERFGVSKTPIREALVRLAGDGLVEITPYRGARAKSYTVDDLRQIYEMREILQSECVRRAAESLSPVVAQRLQRNVAASEEAQRQKDLPALMALLDEYDEILFSQLKNDMLSEILDRLSAHLRRIGRVGVTPDRIRMSLADHRAILKAILGHNSHAAQRQLRRHIDRLRDDQIVALSQGVAG